MTTLEEMTKEEIAARLAVLRKRHGYKVIAQGREIKYLNFLEKRVKDYTCAQIGRMLGHHPDTICSWFKDYPGVITKVSPAKRMKDPKTGQWKVKRRHTILLVPPDVFIQWVREHTKVED